MGSDRRLNSVIPTNDGGYAAIGYKIEDNTHETWSNLLITKYDLNDETEWSNTISGYGDLYTLGKSAFNAITELVGGGYVVVGKNGSRYSDGRIVKYSEEGIQEWTSIISGTGDRPTEELSSVIATNDGGFIVVGDFNSMRLSLGGIELNNKSDYRITYSDGDYIYGYESIMVK